IALRHSLLAAVDQSARDDAVDVAAATRSGVVDTDLVPPETDAVVQVVAPDGSLVAASANAPERPLVPVGGGRRTRLVSTGPLPIRGSADAYRIAAVRTTDGRTVLVALPRDDVTAAVHNLVVVLAVGAPLLFLVLVVLAGLIIRRTLMPVEAMHRRQRQFVADAAHELRTPLAALRAQIDASDGDLGERAGILSSEVQRLSDTVDGLLSLTRVREGQVARDEVDLDDVVRASAHRLRPASPVVIDTSAVEPARVRGDAAALGRLVDNLISNAVRYAASTVTVTLSTDHREAVLTVADDGPGVPLADRERVFDRFTRLDTARSRDAGGVGLGLAIVRGVARAHRGDVVITGAAAGACFVVRMPLVG
ncbi:MAG TPA: ATP-binding protein, partial [Mycobacteriales bacterium]|nr:ATP-binding protein [Mycobacteriales bacterium]